MRNNIFTFILLCLISSSLYGQKIIVSGGFLEDSLSIGNDVHFWLKAQYPDHLELTLPDTNYNFFPFEFGGKQYFPSQIIDDQIIDSAVYAIQSFEITPVQYLSLPIFVLDKKGDTIVLNSDIDSIFFAELAPIVTDTTSLISHTALTAIDTQFNYPILWIFIGVLVILALVIYFVFGRRIKRFFKLKRLRKEYIRFSDMLTEQIHVLKSNPDVKTAEHTLTVWKSYLEKLEKLPYSKYTTREIMSFNHTSELRDPLKIIDKSVFGGYQNQEIYKAFQAIEDFTEHRYKIITEQIRNTK